MDGKPLTMRDAWRVYDRLFEDERVALIPERAAVETRFRDYSDGAIVSPKQWADAWLLAFAQVAEGTVVTFDRALASRGARCLFD